MKRITLLILGLALIYSVKAQLITSDPVLPLPTDQVTIIFDASQGNMGLKGYTGDVYAHTGVITNLSTSGSDWRYVIADWSVNTTKAKMTSLGNDKYQLVITPSIRQFYEVPESESILKMAFVFRSADGSKVGKTADNGDIFVDVKSLWTSFESPTIQPYFIDASSSFDIQIKGYEATSTVIKIDGNTVHTETVSPNAFTYNVSSPYTDISAISNSHVITAEASNAGGTATAEFVYAIRSTPIVEALPVGMRDGINYIDDNTVTLVLQAPFKSSVYAFGSYNDWQPLAMKRTSDNLTTDTTLRYWLTIDGLTTGKEYIFQYIVDEELKIADPYAEKISDPWNDKFIDPATYPDLIKYPYGKTDGIAAVFQTAQTTYNWQVTNFTAPKPEDLVIYELLVRDFADDANYQTLIDTIGYFKRLGINAIELMPINEFDGNNSWGYNPAFYFAPDKAYGTKNKLKEFIDVCHQNGIAVIQDMVLNHSYGNSPFVQLYFDKANNEPSLQNLWFNQTSPNPTYSWGYDFNHEKNPTKALVDSINSFWLNEYKVDGFRFDFTKGFTNTPGEGMTYDQSRINILERMYNQIKARKSAAYVICEHLTDNSEETVLANYGLMLWGNMNWNYSEAAMGYNDGTNSDLTRGSYQARGWSEPNLVSYMESHDEERVMYRLEQYGNATSYYNTKEKVTALKRVELDACFFFTIPGPKMFWQFGELGYDISINDGDRVDPKPIKWDYYDDAYRYKLYQVFGALIKLKKEQAVFETTNYTTDIVGALKQIHLNGTDMKVTVVGNFGVVTTPVNPNFQQTGTWYDYFTGESIDVANVNDNITLGPGEYHIYTTVKLATPDITDPTTGINEITGTNGSEINFRAYPNPATERVNIEFNLDKQQENAEISIYNLNGQKINTLYKGVLSQGQHKFEWQLDGNQGSKVSKGIYLLKISSNLINGNSIIIVK